MTSPPINISSPLPDVTEQNNQFYDEVTNRQQQPEAVYENEQPAANVEAAYEYDQPYERVLLASQQNARQQSNVTYVVMS